MSKVRDISGLANIIKTDANGNVIFVSGSTTLMAISSSGAVTSTGAIGGSNSTTLATTGSNTFTGQQYISNTKAPVNFTDTASLYTDGGLRVGKDAYVSGTLYLNDLTVYGTQSINYITSSQLDISDNIITVNTSTPAIRFGGIAVRDSGSLGTGLTGSLLWDSQRDLWLYSNPSGSTYDSAMVMMGPQSTGSLGNEVGITTNALVKGVGNHHMTSSGIFESGSNVGIGTSTPAFKLDVQGTGRYQTSGNNGIINIGGSSFYSQLETNSTLGGLKIKSIWGATNSGIIQFINGTAENIRMHIADNGNIGIGVTSPTSLLYISASGGLSQDIVTIRGGGGSGAFGTRIESNSGDDLLYVNHFTYDITMATIAGNVGIGTSSPSGKLDISSGLRNGTTSTLFIGADVDSSSGTRTNNTRKLAVIASPHYSNSTRSVFGIAMDNQVSNNFIYIGGAYSGYNAANVIAFSTGDTTTTETGTERMRITSAGNVGIGTTGGINIVSGWTNLTVNGSTTGIIGLKANETDFGAMYASPGNNNFVIQAYGTSNTGNMVFLTNSNERMRINGGGNVFVGNTSGDGRLHVKTASAVAYNASSYNGANANIRLESGATVTTGTTTGIAFGVGGSAEVYIGAVQNGSGLAEIVFQNYDGAYRERMRIVSSGNINLNETVYNNTAVATTRILYIGSDYRIGGISSIRASKKNIENISNVDWIYNLNPVIFNYRKKDEEGNYTEDIYEDLNYGLIAEDTQPVADFLINYNDKKEMIGIEYVRLITPMLKAIQEQQAQINELKAQING